MSTVNQRPAAGRSPGDHPAKSEPARRRWGRTGAVLLFAALCLGGAQSLAWAQPPSTEKNPSRTPPGTLRPQEDATLARPTGVVGYSKPTEATEFRNYLFSAFGPYPIAGAAFAAGISQAGNGIPEWGQGAEGSANAWAPILGSPR